MRNWKIAIGCDPNGQSLKEEIIGYLKEKNIIYKDFGSEDIIYGNTAEAVAKVVANGEFNRGILICGTGIGVSLAANKVPGAYAAPCYDAYATERSILSNNANILALGFQVTGDKLALKLVDLWLNTEFVEGTRSQPKVDKIYEIERSYSKVN